MNLKFLNNNFTDKIIVFLSSIAVVFFSYIPFLYLIPVINLEKYLIFILLITLILIIAALSTITQILRGKIQFSKQNAIALYLYILFAMYSLVSFSFIGEQQNDLFTLRTIILVNPIFVILAFLCLQNKRFLIQILTLLSGIYFVILMISLIFGNISLKPSSFQNIFFDIEGSYYQNINVYLGLFVLCNLGLLSSDNKYVSIIPKILIPFSILGMLIIGGRGAVVALTVVLLMYFIKERIKWSFRIPQILATLILTVTLLMFVTIYYDYISKLFNDSVTLKRLMILTREDDPSSRFFLFSKALELYISDIQTMVFGAGINSFNAYTNIIYPHNIILELLAEYGVVGFILFVFPMLYIFFIRKRVLGSIYGNSTIYEKIIFLIFLYELIRLLFSGGLRNSWVLIFYLFLLLPCEHDIEKYCFKNRKIT